MVIFYAITADIDNLTLYFGGLTALTGSGGFDQCPAPLAGTPALPHPSTDPR
jgi:hypothetical protein